MEPQTSNQGRERPKPQTLILRGHVLDVLKTLPTGTVQCVVTSPPYWSLRKYPIEDVEFPEFEGLAAGCFMLSRCNRWRGQLGLEPSPELYVAHLVQVFREVRRVLRDDGTLWLNMGDGYISSPTASLGNNVHLEGGVLNQAAGLNRPNKRANNLKSKDLLGIPWRVAFALQTDGWWLRQDIIWHKPNPMPESVTDRPTKAHEYVFLMTKSAKYFYDAEAVKEPLANASLKRLRQPGFDQQTGGEKDYGHRTNQNRSARKALCNLKEKLIAQEKWGDRHEGWKEGDPAIGRNCRSVWTIASKPFKEAHFATFPPALAERCVKAGTSERGACPSCGAPWARLRLDASRAGATGWRPSCECTKRTLFYDEKICRVRDIYSPTPCVVLDPFAGSGTVGAVCVALNRGFIGIELSEEYCEMAEKRIGTEAARPRQDHLFREG